MKMILDFKQQIQEMQKQFSYFETESWVGIFEFAEKIPFEKNYLKTDINEEHERLANNIVGESDRLKEEIDRLQQYRNSKSISLHELIPPKFIGKHKYEDQKRELQKQIQDTSLKIMKLNATIEQHGSKFQKAKSFLEKIEQIRISTEKQYEEDEHEFNQIKGELIKVHLEKILTLYSFITDLSWPDFKTDLIEFLKNNPAKELFPKIGWRAAYLIAFGIYIFSLEWFKTENEEIVVGKQKKMLENALSDFLWEFVHGITFDNEIYYLLRANAYYLKLFFLEKMEEIHHLMLSDDPDGKNKALLKYFLIPGAKDELMPYFNEMYKAIEVCKVMSNKNNNADTLKRILILEEGAKNLYDPIYKRMQQEF